MQRAISLDIREPWAILNQRLHDLKARRVPTPNNIQPSGDGVLNKIMDRKLYEAILREELTKFVDALEEVLESRKLELWPIFSQVTPSGNSLLHVAARFGRVDVTKLILVHCRELVTWKNSSEDTPLHVALQYENFELAMMLIGLPEGSRFIYWKNNDNKSPLYLAAEKGCLEILRPLLAASARDEDYADKIEGISPVLAALKGKSAANSNGYLTSKLDLTGKMLWPISSDILQAIIGQLPKLLHKLDENGRTPLHSAASVGNVEVVEFLLGECPYLALQMDKNGSYPIHIACEGGNVNILDMLVEEWPFLEEIKNKKGQNILHVAAEGGKNNVVQWIFKGYNWDVRKMANLKDVDGNTPLHLASMHSHCTVMRSLTKNKISDLQLLNNKKLTALDVAMEFRSVSTKDRALLGRAILIVAGARRSKDILSPREQHSGESKSSHDKSIKDQVNTLLLVATLVASVTFTAGITLPGGYNDSHDPHPGTATMLPGRMFQLFIIANTLAMHSSILAVVVLLWGLSSDFYIAELACRSAGPLLLMALTGMTMAFFAAVTVAVSKLTWLGSLVLSIGALYLAMVIVVLASLIFPFSKFAMRIVSLYYLAVALLLSVTRPLVILGDYILGLIICIIYKPTFLFSVRAEQ